MKKKSLIIIAAINLLLLFAAIFCMAKTCKNNERINNVSAEFCYTETNGKIMLELTSGKAVTMRFGKNAVCVYDCYLYDNSDAAEILLFVRRYGEEHGVTLARKIRNCSVSLRCIRRRIKREYGRSNLKTSTGITEKTVARL